MLSDRPVVAPAFAARLQALMREAGLRKQKDLVALLGHDSPSTVSDWVNGRVRPKFETVRTLADKLGKRVGRRISVYDLCPIEEISDPAGDLERFVQTLAPGAEITVDSIDELGRMPASPRKEEGETTLSNDEQMWLATIRSAISRHGGDVASHITECLHRIWMEGAPAAPKPGRHSGGGRRRM